MIRKTHVKPGDIIAVPLEHNLFAIGIILHVTVQIRFEEVDDDVFAQKPGSSPGFFLVA